MFRKLASSLNQLMLSKPFNLGSLRYMREPMQPIKRCPRWVCVEDAVKIINSEHVVYVQGAAATPMELIRAMTEHGVCNNLRDVRVVHLRLEGDAPFANPEFEKNFRSVSLFIGANVREAVNEGRADSIPIFLHEAPKLFYEQRIVPDVALIHVSTPDARGFVSLGVSVECTKAAIRTSKVIIAQVNEHMPRTFGDTIMHCSHIDWAVKYDCPLPCIATCPPNEIELEIGKIVAQRLVEDGATLQLGVGNIPDAILCALSNHKDLGVHSEIIGDTAIDLAERGNITNKLKTRNKGRMVASMALGTKRVYDFLHNNPFVEMLRVDYVNDPKIIAQLPKMTAINSAIEIDLTGQVCADSLGCKMYSGFGGQTDFIRGAAAGFDGRGRAIIAFPSITAKGESKIQPVLKCGAGVVTTRADIHYVVTEHGVAQLFGKTLRQRANALIEVAHPEHRECLEKAAFERLKTNPTKYL